MHLSSVPGSTGTKRWPQSRQSSPNAHSENSEPGPPSEHAPSEAAYDSEPAHSFEHLIIIPVGAGGGGGHVPHAARQLVRATV